MLLFILWWPLLVELFISLDSRRVFSSLHTYFKKKKKKCRNTKNLLPGYENMPVNTIDNKIWGLMCVILYHSACLIYHRMGFQDPLHLEIKLNEIKSFQHDHFWISITETFHFNNRDRYTLQSKQTFEIQYIHISNAQFYSFWKLYLFLCQHKQTVRKYWRASSFIWICNSLYNISLAYFLKNTAKDKFVVVNYVKVKT